jgi:hypothetical protein
MKDFDMEDECVIPTIYVTPPHRDEDQYSPALLEQLKEPGTRNEQDQFSSLNTMSRIFAMLQGPPGDPPPFHF